MITVIRDLALVFVLRIPISTQRPIAVHVYFLLLLGGGLTEIKLCDMSECIIRVGSMAVNG